MSVPDYVVEAMALAIANNEFVFSSGLDEQLTMEDLTEDGQAMYMRQARAALAVIERHHTITES